MGVVLRKKSPLSLEHPAFRLLRFRCSGECQPDKEPCRHAGPHLHGVVIHIITQHPSLVMETIAAKLGVIAGWLVICANVGLVAAYYYPKHWAIETGCWSAMGFQALPGILTIPARAYLLGFIAFAVLYGV